jgi:hypothetical protein
MRIALITAAVWFFSSVCSVSAIFLALKRSRHFLASILTAIVAITVGTMGFTAWSPFGLFPEIGYSWANGSFQISVRSGWFYIVPLVLGAMGLILALKRCKGKSSDA